MSDRELGNGMAVWIALRRAHRGGVARLAGRWRDAGRPVPGYVAQALEQLTRGGLLVLGEAEPQSCGVRRATVTDTGSAHYVALCRIHHPHGYVTVSTPRRWAHSPYDLRSLTRRARPRPDRGPGRGLRAAHALVDTHQHPTHRTPLPHLPGTDGPAATRPGARRLPGLRQAAG